MSLTLLIEKAATEYVDAKKGRFKGAAIGNIFKIEIPEALKEKIDLSNFTVKGSIGQGTFAEVPWVALMDNDFTKSTQKGVYVVFLFSADGKRVYLSLNQGVTNLKKRGYKPSQIEEIAKFLRYEFLNSYASEDVINLSSNTSLNKGFEQTNIHSIKYEVGNMPPEEQMIADINELLEIYRKITEKFIEVNKDFDQFYSFVEGKKDDNRYVEFKYLLKRFIRQANLNITGSSEKSTSLGDEGFENNKFKKYRDYDILEIAGIEYHIHLFNSGSYGPTKGNGCTRVPYLDRDLGAGNWANIRVNFEDYVAKSIKIVVYSDDEKVKDLDLEIGYDLDLLDLESNNEPNDILQELYDKFAGIATEESPKKSNGKIDKYASSLMNSKNIILRGAPGTGKTYIARQVAAQVIGKSEAELDHCEQYGFVQFHPSYDYTDFVEGLRPVTHEGEEGISFKLVNGIFKEFCEKAIASSFVNEIDNFDDAWDRLINAINESEKDYKMARTEVPATVNTRNSIKFKSPVATKENVYQLYRYGETSLKYEMYSNIVLNHLYEKYGLKKYQEGSKSGERKKNYVFVIDEINRGEISKIFGELFFSIDPGYRGKAKYGVATQYANLHLNKKEKFYIPDNVYIIGTMNDIDRSVDSFDFAMRRRFRFMEITAESNQDMLMTAVDDEGKPLLEESIANEAIEKMSKLNNLISSDEIEELNENYHIGPSYFLKLSELNNNFDLLWTDYLKPLLHDYVRGMHNESALLELFSEAYGYDKNSEN